jgi:protease I
MADELADELRGLRIAFLVANEGVEQAELTEPWKAVEQAGATPTLIATKTGTVQAFQHYDRADTFQVDETTDAADPEAYDALVLPGGAANADQLRTDPKAVHFVRRAFERELPIAVICHGPWILADAGVAHGRVLTSWPSLRTDLTNAGAEWVDEEVRVDRNLVSSRKPDDLPAFCRELVRVFSSAPRAAA